MLGGRIVYIFPKTCLNVKWINDFLLEHKVYFVDSPKKKFYVFYDNKLINDLKKIFEKNNQISFILILMDMMSIV